MCVLIIVSQPVWAQDFQASLKAITTLDDYQAFAYHESTLDSLSEEIIEYTCQKESLVIPWCINEIWYESNNQLSPMVLLYEYLDLSNIKKWSAQEQRRDGEMLLRLSGAYDYDFYISLFDAEGLYGSIVDQRISGYSPVEFFKKNQRFFELYLEFLISKSNQRGLSN